MDRLGVPVRNQMTTFAWVSFWILHYKVYLPSSVSTPSTVGHPAFQRLLSVTSDTFLPPVWTNPQRFEGCPLQILRACFCFFLSPGSYTNFSHFCFPKLWFLSLRLEMTIGSLPCPADSSLETFWCRGQLHLIPFFSLRNESPYVAKCPVSRNHPFMCNFLLYCRGPICSLFFHQGQKRQSVFILESAWLPHVLPLKILHVLRCCVLTLNAAMQESGVRSVSSLWLWLSYSHSIVAKVFIHEMQLLDLNVFCIDCSVSLFASYSGIVFSRSHSVHCRYSCCVFFLYPISVFIEILPWGTPVTHALGYHWPPHPPSLLIALVSLSSSPASPFLSSVRLAHLSVKSYSSLCI